MTPSRRDFLKASAASVTVFACSRAPAATTPALSSVRVDVRALDADGASLVTEARGPDGMPILIVRRSATAYDAYSMLCTHEGCPLPPPQRGVVTCRCHGSRFDLYGRVLQGPAVYPLGRYRARFVATEGTLVVLFGP